MGGGAIWSRLIKSKPSLLLSLKNNFKVEVVLTLIKDIYIYTCLLIYMLKYYFGN